MSSARGPVRQLPALTGVRGIAALWVVLLHASPRLYKGTGWSDVAVFEMAYFGVDIFFMLSGFILAHVHFRDFETFTWKATGEFIYLRISRIYPVHLFSLAVVLGFFLLTVALGKPLYDRPRFGLDLFVGNLFLVQSWGWAHNDSWNILAWSISTEWLMYLLFPIIAFALAQLRWGIVAIACAILSLLAAIVVLHLLGLEGTFTTYRFGAARTFFTFLAGCFAYVAYKSGSLAHWPWRVLELSSVVWLFAALFIWRSSFAALPAVLFLILSLAAGQGIVSQLLASRPAIYLGEISYSLYMMHMIVLELCFLPLDYSRFGTVGGPLHLAWLAVSLVVVGAVTVWTHKHVEKPARVWLRGLAGGRPAAGQLGA